MSWKCSKCDRQYGEGIVPMLAFNFVEIGSLNMFIRFVPRHLRNYARGLMLLKKPVYFCYDCFTRDDKGRKVRVPVAS